jgi:hypothetical protein
VDQPGARERQPHVPAASHRDDERGSSNTFVVPDRVDITT